MVPRGVRVGVAEEETVEVILPLVAESVAVTVVTVLVNTGVGVKVPVKKAVFVAVAVITAGVKLESIDGVKEPVGDGVGEDTRVSVMAVFGGEAGTVAGA